MSVRNSNASGAGWIVYATPEQLGRINSYPITMHCWAYAETDPNSGNKILMGLSDGGSPATAQAQILDWDTGANRLSCYSYDGALSESDLLSWSTTGEWYSACAVFRSATNRQVYGNGSAGNIGTTSSSPSGMDNLGLTCGYTGSISDPYPGYVAHAAVWDAELTLAEINALAAGWSPTRIRPDRLVMYVPARKAAGENIVDVISGRKGQRIVSGAWPQSANFNPPSESFAPAKNVLLPTSAAAAGAPGTVTGSGAVQAQAATASGTGVKENIGSGTPQAQAATAAGVGVKENIGSGTPQAQAATASGAGTKENIGSGTPQAQAATAAGVGVKENIGSGTPQAQDATTVGTGNVTAAGTVVGSGAVQAQPATVSGSGLKVVTGSGAVQAQRATITADATHTNDFATDQGGGSGLQYDPGYSGRMRRPKKPELVEAPTVEKLTVEDDAVELALIAIAVLEKAA